MPASELIAKTATEIVTLLKAGEVSSLDLLDALEARIAEVEPAVNALPTLCLDRARDAAKALTAKPVAARGGSEERRVGKECVSTGRSWWAPETLKKKKNKQN